MESPKFRWKSWGLHHDFYAQIGQIMVQEIFNEYDVIPIESIIELEKNFNLLAVNLAEHNKHFEARDVIEIRDFFSKGS